MAKGGGGAIGCVLIVLILVIVFLSGLLVGLFLGAP